MRAAAEGAASFTSGTTRPKHRLRGKVPVRSAIGATRRGRPPAGCGTSCDPTTCAAWHGPRTRNRRPGWSRDHAAAGERSGARGGSRPLRARRGRGAADGAARAGRTAGCTAMLARMLGDPDLTARALDRLLADVAQAAGAWRDAGDRAEDWLFARLRRHGREVEREAGVEPRLRAVAAAAERRARARRSSDGCRARRRAGRRRPVGLRRSRAGNDQPTPAPPPCPGHARRVIAETPAPAGARRPLAAGWSRSGWRPRAPAAALALLALRLARHDRAEHDPAGAREPASCRPA